MHEYATNVDRYRVVIVLALLGIVAALGFNALLQKLMLQIPWWVDAPSVMGFYGIFYLLYNRVLWRLRLGPIPLSRIPDVRGVWAGILTSSFHQETKTIIVFYIYQTWSKIAIRTETENSSSYTVMAAFNTQESRDPGLKYEYVSEPEAFAKETMHMHRGTGHLNLSSDGKMLNGGYYTGRDRQTVGTLNLYFISKEKERMNREEAIKHIPQPVK